MAAFVSDVRCVRFNQLTISCAQHHRRVYILHRGVTPLHHSDGFDCSRSALAHIDCETLTHVRHEQPVDDEPRCIFARHRRLVHLLRYSPQGIVRLVCCLRDSDNLHELHLWYGYERSTRRLPVLEGLAVEEV